jgi:hypothetical protein
LNTVSPLLDDARGARVPRDGLAALAPLRRVPGVRVVETSGEAWVVWDGAMPSVMRALLAVSGVAFYSHADGRWRELNAALPDFTVPDAEDALDLARAVVPAPLDPVPPPDLALMRVDLQLVPCAQPRPATALRCSLDVLLGWCERATAIEISRLSGAANGRRVWLRGEALPPLPGAERFWGTLVLAPLGLRPEPEWPEGRLRAAAAIDDGELLVLTPDGAEALPLAAFRPLARAAVRRAAGEVERP